MLSSALLALALGAPALASGDGISGYSGEVDTCAACHTDTDVYGAAAEITGSATATPGEVVDLHLVASITTGTPDRASFDISVGVGTLVATAPESHLADGEIVHNSSPDLLFAENTADLPFQWQAPDTPQTVTLYACVNAVNGSGTNGDDVACTTTTIEVAEAVTTPPTDSGTPTGPTGTPGDTDAPGDSGELPEDDEGCGCASGGSVPVGGLLVLTCAALVRRRRA